MRPRNLWPKEADKTKFAEASMRPGDETPEFGLQRGGDDAGDVASMRPGR